MKLVKGAAKAMRGKKNSKGLKATTNKDIQTLTMGRAKATTRNVRVKKFMDPITKGKNKNFVKDANKKTVPSASTSRRASVKEASFNTRMEKHPLVRNTGQSSAEGKYRGNRGKPIPTKKRGN